MPRAFNFTENPASSYRAVLVVSVAFQHRICIYTLPCGVYYKLQRTNFRINFRLPLTLNKVFVVVLDDRREAQGTMAHVFHRNILILSMENPTHKLFRASEVDSQSELIPNKAYCHATNQSTCTFPGFWKNSRILEHN